MNTGRAAESRTKEGIVNAGDHDKQTPRDDMSHFLTVVCEDLFKNVVQLFFLKI